MALTGASASSCGPARGWQQPYACWKPATAPPHHTGGARTPAASRSTSEPVTARRTMRETCAPAPGDAHRTAPGVTMVNRTGAGGPPGLETGGDGRSQIPPGLDRAGVDVRRFRHHRGQEAGGAARTRTGDGGFADLCLATWRRRRQDGDAGGSRRQPLAVTRRAGSAVRAWRGADRPRRRKMERETGFEPATSTMARSHSTTELFPLAPNAPSKVPQGEASLQGPFQARPRAARQRPAPDAALAAARDTRIGSLDKLRQRPAPDAALAAGDATGNRPPAQHGAAGHDQRPADRSRGPARTIHGAAWAPPPVTISERASRRRTRSEST